MNFQVTHFLGVDWVSIAWYPSLPSRFDPQVKSSPVFVIAAEWCFDAAILMTFLFAKNATCCGKITAASPLCIKKSAWPVKKTSSVTISSSLKQAFKPCQVRVSLALRSAIIMSSFLGNRIESLWNCDIMYPFTQATVWDQLPQRLQHIQPFINTSQADCHQMVKVGK